MEDTDINKCPWNISKFLFKLNLYSLFLGDRKNSAKALSDTETIEIQNTEDLQQNNNVSHFSNVEDSVTSSCSGCSKGFYPLTKLQAAISAVIIIVTWLYMFYSSMRLLWLRKHSSNVFVRCSALWRFILLTTIFYMVATSFYVGLCFIDVTGDVITPAQSLIIASSSGMQYENLSPYLIRNFTSHEQFSLLSDTMTSSKYFKIFCFVTSHSGIYLSLSSLFLLFHSTLAPLFYLLRLLGIRRLTSFCNFTSRNSCWFNL